MDWLTQRCSAVLVEKSDLVAHTVDCKCELTASGRPGSLRYRGQEHGGLAADGGGAPVRPTTSSRKLFAAGCVVMPVGCRATVMLLSHLRLLCHRWISARYRPDRKGTCLLPVYFRAASPGSRDRSRVGRSAACAGSMLLQSLAVPALARAELPRQMNRAEYEACQTRDEAAFRGAIENLTLKSLQQGLKKVDYPGLVNDEWRKAGFDDILDKRVDPPSPRSPARPACGSAAARCSTRRRRRSSPSRSPSGSTAPIRSRPASRPSSPASPAMSAARSCWPPPMPPSRRWNA